MRQADTVKKQSDRCTAQTCQVYGAGPLIWLSARRASLTWAILLVFAILAVTLCLDPAAADTPVDLSGGIRIEAATATPAIIGGTSRIRFRIVNDSATTIHLLGISTAIAVNAELVAAIGSKRSAILESIVVPALETLDLSTSHLRFEISPLNRGLATGDEFPVNFVFVNGEVTVVVHVHPES